MTLLQTIFHVTNFRSPLLRTIVPTVSAAFVLQAATAVPSIAAQSDRFYDLSGFLTYLSCTALSLYLPHLRTRFAADTGGKAAKSAIPSLLSAFGSQNGVTAFNWRQVVLSTAVSIWALRLGSHLFARVLKEGKDSRFDKIKTAPSKFAVAFFGQACWVSICLLPVMAVNAVPAASLSGAPGATVLNVVGLLVWLGGFGYEAIADLQKQKWLEQKNAKLHDEQFITRGLWGRSQYPNYFGEITLWTGLAIAAGGSLVSTSAQLGLGLSNALGGRFAALAMAFISPLFASLLLLKVSGVPLSEMKYDKKFGERKDYQEWKKNTPKLIPKIW